MNADTKSEGSATQAENVGAGAAGGAAAGAVIGMVVLVSSALAPVIGTVAGSLLGAGVGWLVDKKNRVSKTEKPESRGQGRGDGGPPAIAGL